MQRRELCRTGDGEYLLVVRFASQRNRDEMGKFVGDKPAAGAFSSLIDLSAMSVEVHEVSSEFGVAPGAEA
jgi:hypothetical protein